MMAWDLTRSGKRNVRFEGEIIAIGDSGVWNNRWYDYTLYRTKKRGTFILEAIHRSNWPSERTFTDIWIENEREGEPIWHLDGFSEIPEGFKQEAIDAGFTGFTQAVE